MKIQPQHVVSLTYDLYVNKENGEEGLVESATQEQPLTFLFGAGQMIPKFEEHLSTLSTGDAYDFRISAEDGYGEYDQEAVANLPKEMFQGTDLPQVGEILPLQDNNGNRFQGQVVSVTEDSVMVDLNHPMAGQELHFKGEIINVRPATSEELSHGHAHGPDGHHGH
ncbi:MULTISPECIES: FKBP-type peptidyl-prolyl cis-trans isomerase [unclassified Mucilaginibacter]|uniref:FKBP-type peptidyl-prolyl cis-trans isomerase n=1 Tax=unclassified Mucilaginibacter TaxID=2617802 RepID=UPI000960044C|nr:MULTISPECIES: peptidylprolyl isomerase [unclassified Mucilaginibacter]OJW16991.1 MAG: peptidylprolyl isomerase [Mucilaginibacter sp. 44-25]PLW91407.1 MAG: peptidylprolyl isomerase [Mucilaginibacter sp.]HEK20558.1 peptidylprolyl isomerase [Bacteroidota bacterium]